MDDIIVSLLAFCVLAVVIISSELECSWPSICRRTVASFREAFAAFGNSNPSAASADHAEMQAFDFDPGQTSPSGHAASPLPARSESEVVVVSPVDSDSSGWRVPSPNGTLHRLAKLRRGTPEPPAEV